MKVRFFARDDEMADHGNKKCPRAFGQEGKVCPQDKGGIRFTGDRRKPQFE
ncbi:MAG: hypothetical protein Q4G61_00165 [Tissierellia bacterium]|nr:hypothetical protein [Tissierellia bacterium]